MTWIHESLLAAGAYIAPLAEYVNELRFLTPARAHVVIVVATIVFGGLVVDTWLRHVLGGYRRVAVASISVPVFLALMLQVPGGYHGVPDDRCAEYGGGRLDFELLGMIETPKQSAREYGDALLLLIVRARERWGEEQHLCRLSLGDPRVRELLKAVRTTGRRGTVRFSFNGEGQRPNVRFTPTAPPTEKNAPPEAWERGERGT